MSSASDDATPEHPWLSLVIPAYNEARRLPATLASAREWLRHKPATCEVLVVDDGSTDATAALVQELAASWPALRLVRGPHRGKGGAVREGILAARGEYVALADADFSMPMAQFDRLFADALDHGCDIAIGSREATGARRFGEPRYRHLMGRVFNHVVQLLLPGIQDSQCGFKALRRAVAVDVVERQTIVGWGFDVELLYIARRRGYRIREVGIDWYYMPESRVSPLRDTLTMLRDVAQIAWNARRGVYDAAAATGAKTSTKSLEETTAPARDG